MEVKVICSVMESAVIVSCGKGMVAIAHLVGMDQLHPSWIPMVNMVNTLKLHIILEHVS